MALESRQRITGGATGAVALLPRASGGAVDVAYPSGNVVVVSEVSATGALSDAPVVIRPGSAEDGATPSPGAGGVICAWAPSAERAGLLAIGALGAVHLYAPSDASDDASDAGVYRWTLVDRIALDADATALTWTDDGDTIVVATASGFVGAFEWRVAEGQAPTTIGQPDASSSSSTNNGDGGATDDGGGASPSAEWRRRARAPVAQTLIAAGRDARAPFITAGGGTSRRAFLWRENAASRDVAAELRHPAPVVNVAARPGPCDGDSALTAALTVAADGAARLWTRALDPSSGPGTTNAFFQALTIQAETGPATGAPNPRTSDLLAARWISTASGEYAAGIGRDGVVRVWRCVGVDGFGDGPATARAPDARLWATARLGRGGDFEGLNAGCGVSWTCEPAGVAGRVARIAFASAETGVRRAEVSLEEPRVADENDEGVEGRSSLAGSSLAGSSFAGSSLAGSSFIGHGARVTSAIAVDGGIVSTTDESGVAFAWRVTAGGTLEPASDVDQSSLRRARERLTAETGIHEGMPSDAVAVAAAPFGTRVAAAFASGRVAVYEGEANAGERFALEAELIGGDEEEETSTSSGAGGRGRTAAAAELSWFDAGAGCALLAVGVGSSVAAYARIPSRDGTAEGAEGAEDADDGRRGRERGGWTRLCRREFDDECGVSACAWTPGGESLVVGVGREVHALGVGPNLAATLANAAAPLPAYHPSVLSDWLARGEIGRARDVARNAIAHLRAIDDGTSAADPSAGPAPVPIAELIAQAAFGFGPDPPPAAASSSFGAGADPGDVPTFDAGAFGGFAGFAPAPPRPALFTFGQDLAAEETDEKTPAEGPVARVGNARPGERFSAAEAEDGAELVATRGDALPGLRSDERMALLGAFDALRDADGGGGDHSGVDEAGRRAIGLARRGGSRLRVPRGHPGHPDAEPGATLDARGPSGETLAWALQCDTQDALLSSLLSSESACAWSELRRLGVPLWVRDDGKLRRLVDTAARAEFAATRDPGGENPCALLYAALGRTSVLAGLFKAARDTRLAEFLSRNFAEDRHREAALKNAYALMSKHRHAFAATFFVLAGEHADAAALVWRRLGDLSLAVTVARLAPADARSRLKISSETAPASRPEITGGGAKDDGMLSADAFFPGFGAVEPAKASSPDARAKGDALAEADPDPRGAPPAAEPEAPLPASLSPLVKDFLRREIVPSLVEKDEMKDAWTLAALRWMCGDGSESVRLLSGFAPAADLCGFISSRGPLRLVAPRLADAAGDAAAASRVPLILALEARGMPLAALEMCARGVGGGEAASIAVSDKIRGRLAAAALAAEAFGPPGSSVPDGERIREIVDALEAGMRSRDVVVPAPETLESLMRRRELAARAAAARAEAERRVSVHFFGSPRSSLGSPRFASLERIRVGRKNRGVSENFTPASPTTPSPRASHGRDFMQSGFDVFVNTSLVGTPTKIGSVAPNRRALRTPLEIAKLTGDAFHGVCLNPTAPHQLGLAAVRKGLVIADLTRLGPDAEHAAAALRSASAASRNLQRTPGEGFGGYPKPSAPGEEGSSPGRGGPTRPSTDVAARCVAAHPSRPLLLAGAAAGSAVLWRFDAERGAAGGVAMPRAARPDASHPARPGPVTAVAWSPGTGVGFAIGGWDGDACAWRGDGYRVDGAPACEWTPHRAGGDRRWGDSRVEALAYLSPMVIALVGKNLCETRGSSGDGGASVALWDTLLPGSKPAAAFSPHGPGGATAATTLLGLGVSTDGGGPAGVAACGPWPLVATAGRNGDVAAHDLRSLGGSPDGARSVLWRASASRAGGEAHVAKVTALASLAGVSGASSTGSLLVSGCKDGDVRVWSGGTGAHLQRVHGAHERHTFVAPRGGGQNIAYVGVSEILALEGSGVLTCGGDGTVKLFRLTNEAFGLAGEGSPR